MAISLFRSGNGQEQQPLPAGIDETESCFDFDNDYYNTAKDEKYPQVPSEQVLAEIATRAVERRAAKRELLSWQYVRADNGQQEEWDAFASRGSRRN